MRIVQLITRRQRRGAEVFAVQLAEGLARGGHETVLVALYEPPAESLAVPRPIAVHDLGGDAARTVSLPCVAELIRLLRRVRPDVVQANGSSTLKYASLARKLSRSRWPLVYRNIGIASDWLRTPAHRAWGRWLLREVMHVAAVSDFSREDFRRSYGIAAARISTIPVGVPIPAEPRTREARARLLSLVRLPPDAEIIVHVGSFSPEKNHLWLLDAFASLSAHRASAHLLLFGDGALRPQIELGIERRGLGERVQLLGSRGDVSMLLGAADLLVLPSTTEGLPAVILEAAAEAVAAVATRVGGVPEAVVDGISGVLVEPGDVSAFVSAVDELLSDRELRCRMGEAARAFVAGRYDIQGIIGRFERLYTCLLQADSADREGRRSAHGVQRDAGSGGSFSTRLSSEQPTAHNNGTCASARQRIEHGLDVAMRHSPAQPLFRWRASRRLVILAYHEVSDPVGFNRQVEYLRAAMQPVSLEHVIAAIEQRDPLPHGAVLITFDDGHRSVYEAAMPVLRKHGVPAVVLVVAGVLDTCTPFWWQEVEELVRRGARAPGLPAGAPALCVRLLKRLPDEERLRVMDRLRCSVPGAPVNMPQLRHAELPVLEAAGIVVGNHTRTHPCLDRCTDTKLVAEIADAHAILTRSLGHEPTAFAYPNGNADERAAPILEELGYQAAFLFDHRVGAFPPRDRYRISRVRVSCGATAARFRISVSGLHPSVHHLLGRP